MAPPARLTWVDAKEVSSPHDLPTGSSVAPFSVVATAVDTIYVMFECPFCVTSIKKNGEAYARARAVIHGYGSGGELTPRNETCV